MPFWRRWLVAIVALIVSLGVGAILMGAVVGLYALSAHLFGEQGAAGFIVVAILVLVSFCIAALGD